MRQTDARIATPRYNAGESRHEALVTFYTDQGRLRVPGQFKGPLDADPEMVRQALLADAMKQRLGHSGFIARLARRPGALPLRQRAVKRRAPRGPAPETQLSPSRRIR